MYMFAKIREHVHFFQPNSEKRLTLSLHYESHHADLHKYIAEGVHVFFEHELA